MNTSSAARGKLCSSGSLLNHAVLTNARKITSSRRDSYPFLPSRYVTHLFKPYRPRCGAQPTLSSRRLDLFLSRRRVDACRRFVHRWHRPRVVATCLRFGTLARRRWPDIPVGTQRRRSLGPLVHPRRATGRSSCCAPTLRLPASFRMQWCRASYSRRGHRVGESEWRVGSIGLDPLVALFLSGSAPSFDLAASARWWRAPFVRAHGWPTAHTVT